MLLVFRYCCLFTHVFFVWYFTCIWMLVKHFILLYEIPLAVCTCSPDRRGTGAFVVPREVWQRLRGSGWSFLRESCTMHLTNLQRFYCAYPILSKAGRIKMVKWNTYILKLFCREALILTGPRTTFTTSSEWGIATQFSPCLGQPSNTGAGSSWAVTSCGKCCVQEGGFQQ